MCVLCCCSNNGNSFAVARDRFTSQDSRATRSRAKENFKQKDNVTDFNTRARAEHEAERNAKQKQFSNPMPRLSGQGANNNNDTSGQSNIQLPGRFKSPTCESAYAAGTTETPQSIAQRLHAQDTKNKC
jgi:hypothetical protein